MSLFLFTFLYIWCIYLQLQWFWPIVYAYLFITDEIQKVALTGLSDAIENRLTLKYSDGTFYRITLPSLATSPLVERCLISLRQVLSNEISIVFLCRFYAARNVIGSEDITSEQEWVVFSTLLFGKFALVYIYIIFVFF